jgi:hypothetical protein
MSLSLVLPSSLAIYSDVIPTNNVSFGSRATLMVIFFLLLCSISPNHRTYNDPYFMINKKCNLITCAQCG